MFGCSCRREPCECQKKRLPYSLTITPVLSGTTYYSQPLAVDSCFGKGAFVHAIEEIDAGCTNHTAVLQPGSGYAVRGRVEPTLTITAPSGSGCTFTATFTETASECSECLKTWSIESVAISGDGSGYSDGPLVVTLGADTYLEDCDHAALTLTVEDGVPSSVAVTNGGTYYGESNDEPACVAAVTVAGTGVECSVSTDREDGTFGQVVAVTGDLTGVGGGTDPSTFVAASEDCIKDGGPLGLPNEAFVVANVLASDGVSINEGYCRALRFLVRADYGSGADIRHAQSASCYTRHAPGKLVANASFVQSVLTVSKGTEPAPENSSLDEYEYWYISAANVSGGCGWETGDTITGATLADQTELEPEWNVQPVFTVTATDGVITSATVTNGGKFHTCKYYPGQGGIGELLVTDGGSGYAVYGREEPESPSFSPAGPWTPTYTQHEDEFGRPYWSIASIAVGSGSGFTDGQALTASSSWPEIGGSFSATIRTSRVEPTISAKITGSGAGAAFTVSVEPSTASTWRVSGVSVTSAGSGYTTDDAEVEFYATAGNEFTTVVKALARAVLNETGGVESVTVRRAGEYFKPTDEPESVAIQDAGVFYRENKDLPPHVANVTVEVCQLHASAGSGADITGEVYDDPSDDATFGRLKRVVINDPGENYMAWFGSIGSGEPPPGEFSVMESASQLEPGGACVTLYHLCDFLVDGRGAGLNVISLNINNTTTGFISETLDDCASFPFTLYDSCGNAAFTVTAGGVFERANTCACPEPAAGGCPAGTARPYGLSATASVSFTIPAMDEGSNTLCVDGEYTDTAIALANVCAESPWLEGEAVLDGPEPESDDHRITATVTVDCVDGELEATVSVSATCYYTYTDGNNNLVESRPVISSTQALTYTTDANGFAIPDDVEWEESVVWQGETFTISASITFA